MPGLADYSLCWDHARAQGDASRVYADDDLLLATDFEGGNGYHLRRLGEDRYALDLEPEPGQHRFSGSSYYYCFGIRNLRAEPCLVHVRLQDQPPGNEDFARGVRQAIVRRGDAWQQLDSAGIHAVDGVPNCQELDLLLPPCSDPNNTLFVSDFHWWPYSEVVAYLRALEGVRLVEIGRSYEGRPLYAVEMGPENAPCMVHTQTPQPSEMGHLACKALIDYLLSDDPQAMDMRSRFHLCFVPITNPDGAVHGYGVSDAQGRFPYFEGDLAAEGDPTATPEMLAVWRYLEQKRPWLFWEWHSNNWARRPGHMLLRYRHELCADEKMRRLWNDVEERLLALPNTYHGNWTSYSEGLYQPTLGFQAITRLGAIACMIKQHEKYPLQESAVHAVACLQIAVQVWEEKGA